MFNRRRFLSVSAIALVAGCGVFDPMSRIYDGPAVTHVEVRKSERLLLLWSNGSIIRSYPVELGFAPNGAKQFEGDGKTPEGSYWINRRNPESKFFLSLGISYPNAIDIVNARENGLEPGGDIFIHGQSAARISKLAGPDWTAGCIAVSNKDMRELYWMVRVGTPITIRA